MITNHDIVHKAKSFIGKQEIPIGSHSNSGPFVRECQQDSFLGGTGWPWCAAFVDHVCHLCGVPLAYNGAGAHDLANHHLPWVPASRAEPGMVVDYNIGSGHTGIVTGVDVRAGTLTSVDGNWADAVVEHTMQISQVRAFWKIPRVNYASGTAPVPSARRKPVWQVVTSHRGHRKIVFRAAKKQNVVDWIMHHSIAKLFPNGITIKKGKTK